MPAEIYLTPNGANSRLQTLKTKEGKKEMKLFKAATTVCGMALMGVLFALGAEADELNRKTVVTFRVPVEIPAVHLAGWGVLPAGTYVFKILIRSPTATLFIVATPDETERN